jgi:hypothetical protein
MQVCPIRLFRILRRLDIVNYVQHMLAGVRDVYQWKHKAEMVGLFLLFTCATSPFFAFVRILCDHSAKRTATLTKLTRALLLT